MIELSDLQHSFHLKMPSLQLVKTPCFSYYCLWFFFYKIGDQEGITGSARGRGRLQGKG
jgi:hypothetical protein